MKEFYIIGISVRTINKDNQSAIDIGGLWNRWFTEELSVKIENKISNEIINMYTDYKSDEHDCYTAILGHKVSSLDPVPEGFIGKHISDKKYKEFISKVMTLQASHRFNSVRIGVVIQEVLIRTQARTMSLPLSPCLSGGHTRDFITAF